MAALGGVRLHNVPDRATVRRVAASVLLLWTGARAHAQVVPTDGTREMLRLARADSDSALVLRVQAAPDDARDALRRLLASAASDTAARDRVAARRLAASFTTAWKDSFLVEQVTRYDRLPFAGRNTWNRADSARVAGNTLLERRGVAAAMPRWRASLRLFRSIDDTSGSAAALGNIGIGFLYDDALDSAESYLTRSFTLATAVRDARTAANAVSALGNLARARGESRAAYDFFIRAESLHARGGDPRGVAADVNNLGLVAQELGDLHAAQKAFARALAMNRAAGRDSPAATNLVNLGNVLSLDGRYAAAADAYREALGIYRRSSSAPNVAFVLHSLGALSLRRGDLEAAVGTLEEAAALYARTGPVSQEIAVRQDLVAARSASGDLRGAQRELEHAEAIAATDAQPQRGETLAELAVARGDVELAFNRLPDAARSYERAATLAREAADGTVRASAQQGLGTVLLVRERYDRAEAVLSLALRSYELAGDPRSAALTRVLIAHAGLARGDSAAARRSATAALAALTGLGDVVGQAAALGVLGDVELRALRPVAAESVYRRGLAVLGARRAPDVVWQLHQGAAHARAAQSDNATAVTELELAVREIESVAGTVSVEERRAEYFADKWDVYAELALREHARGREVEAFSTSERMRARQMLDLLARGRVTIHADSGLVEQEQDLRRRIAELTRDVTAPEPGDARDDTRGVSPAGAERGAALEALAQAEQSYGELLTTMRERHPAYATVVHGETAELAAIQNALAAGDLLLEYLVGDSTTLVFAIARDTIVAIDLNVSHAALAAEVDLARATLSRPNDAGRAADWRAPMHRLYQQLVAPVAERGMLRGKRRLLIAPHAELHYLPFAALLSPDAREGALVQRFDVAMIPSASVWVALRQRSRATGPALLAPSILALAPRARELPGTVAEVEALRRVYGGHARVLLGAAATERAFRSLAPSQDVVHLATYGVLNKHNPLFSYVALGSGAGEDGRLETHEVFGLELHARLLVLSACQTAVASGALADVPPGDDWVGLVRSFLFAGASNVAATLWPVEDRATATLMEAMHRELILGRPPEAALAAAQRTMAGDSRYSHPFYWAGFVVVTGQ